MGQANTNSPGTGGINRGRGDAELSIGDPRTPFDAESFEAKRLTPAEYADLDRSALVGVGAAAPNASGVDGQSTGDAGAERSVGASTWKRRLEPRHRRAVSSFFGGAAGVSGGAAVVTGGAAGVPGGAAGPEPPAESGGK